MAVAGALGLAAPSIAFARPDDRFAGFAAGTFQSRGEDYPALVASPTADGPLSGAAILMFHGAGGLWSDFDTFAGPARRWAGLGATVVLPTYFSSAPNAAISDDTTWWGQAAADAAAWTERLPGVDADRMGAFGFSRGGYVAAETAVQRTNIRSVVGVASAGNVEPTDIRRSPEVLLIYASWDPVIPPERTRRWAGILEAAGIDVNVIRLNSPRHLFNTREWETIFDEAETFLLRSLAAS